MNNDISLFQTPFFKVFEESLRLHPPVTMIQKVAEEEIITIDYRIPKKTDVIVCSVIIALLITI